VRTRRAIVTGASRGIGKAIAIALAQAGYDVAIAARTVESEESRDNSPTVHRVDHRQVPGTLRETARQIARYGCEAIIAPVDLTDRESVAACGEQIAGVWPEIDLIVHNGRFIGPGLADAFMDTPVWAYSKFVEAHCIAPILLTRRFLPGMLDQGSGQVITITSNAAYEPPSAPVGEGGWGLAYSVGKAAGHSLVGALHAEFGGRGIDAYNVHPGFVATERNQIAGTKAFEQEFGAPALPGSVGAVVA
tara:strand:- start:5210 stop:5953 length:744 start_codon:yes stop_codon:yes gene_type:complete